jgi:tetratricopeptide (TPR) repeat protein
MQGSLHSFLVYARRAQTAVRSILAAIVKDATRAVTLYRPLPAVFLFTACLAGSLSMAQQPSPQAAAPSKEIEFSDKPDFTVAGVTDWTAVGGHGSDATLRTSESLAKETLRLKAPTAGQDASGHPATSDADGTEARLRAALAAAPKDYAAIRAMGEYYLRAAKFQQAVPLLESALSIHKAVQDEYDLALACQGIGDLAQARQHVQHAMTQKDSADIQRLAGEIDEERGDSLAAVQELRRATEMQASEENYFAWGSELLLHRAVWQAAEVFRDGVKLHPDSARLRTAWGTALFSGALYDQAALQFCAASDLKPSDAETYLVLGKIELASPTALPCVEERLARFLKLHPESARANFFYAMVLLKSDRQNNLQRAEGLLRTAVKLDPHDSEAYLQLGILSFAQKKYPEAIGLYNKAVEADPQQGEAHYRLALAYDRIGDADRARQEFRAHDAIEKAQADAVEAQRRQIKQFLVVPQGQPVSSAKP